MQRGGSKIPGVDKKLSSTQLLNWKVGVMLPLRRIMGSK